MQFHDFCGGVVGDAKVPLWDEKDLVISSFNWGSQGASYEHPLDELGILIYGEGIADLVHSKLMAFSEPGTSRASDRLQI